MLEYALVFGVIFILPQCAWPSQGHSARPFRQAVFAVALLVLASAQDKGAQRPRTSFSSYSHWSSQQPTLENNKLQTTAAAAAAAGTATAAAAASAVAAACGTALLNYPLALASLLPREPVHPPHRCVLVHVEQQAVGRQVHAVGGHGDGVCNLARSLHRGAF